MMNKIILFYFTLFISLMAACTGKSQVKSTVKNKIIKTEEEWKQLLTPEQYRILREKGTERAWTGEYNDFKGEGMYLCAACKNPLFRSETKFESGSGWPSFYNYASDTSVVNLPDYKHGMVRTEVLCARCGGHLGHVFEDGPNPTGLRYCINSASLAFEPEEGDAKKKVD